MHRTVLISGGGIAGLTLAIQLKQSGFEPLVIEREPSLRGEGYMMDFYGTGWDVAERMGLIERLREIKYPIDALEFVNEHGTPWLQVPLARIRAALGGRYTYLRRPDLERVLMERAQELGVEIRFGTELHTLSEQSDHVRATFVGGMADRFALVIGADGVHSRVRALAFGPEWQYSRYLGMFVAALHMKRGDGLDPVRACALYEERDRTAFFYPLDDEYMDATFVFRYAKPDVPTGQGLAILRSQFRDAGAIASDTIESYEDGKPIYFDSATQICMSRWHRGRIALIGDACGCLTLLAGQGSHMAMAGGYVLADQLARHSDHAAAFRDYQVQLAPHVDKKQRDAARFADLVVPSKRSRPWLRRLALRLFFSPVGLRYGLDMLGGKSVLPN